MSLAETVAAIRYHHRNRCYAMQTCKALDLRLGWFLKTQLGWSKALPKAERDTIADRAAELVKIGAAIAKGKTDERPEDFAPLEGIILAALLARDPFDQVEKNATKAMEKLAQSLPVWLWVESIRGFGAVSLAVIVAETGLTSCERGLPPENGNYPNPDKLNKRMGLAVFDGVRQGGLSKNASKEAWVEHGYSRIRRSCMWNIGDALVKGNRDGPYRTLYLERKEYEVAKAKAEGMIVALAASIPKGKAAQYRSIGHIHRRAQRVMEKRLLRDLWLAWREANNDVEPKRVLPLAAE